MTKATAPSLASRAKEARKRLDDHVRDMVRWHFDPATGCPFWLERARRLDFDPREAIRGYDDLKVLGHFEDEWLRGGPVRRWVPKGLEGKPLYVFETGGSTGIPKCRVNIEDFQTDYEEFGDRLDDRTFPRGSDWLMLGPTGPRRLRLAIEHLAQYRGGIAFFVVYAVIRTQRYLALGEMLDLVQAVVALLVALGFQVYFRSLARWGKR